MNVHPIPLNLTYTKPIQERNSIGPLFDTLPIEIVLIILYTLDTRSCGRLALTNWKWSQIIAHECKIEEAYRSKLKVFDASSWYKMLSKSLDLKLPSITDEPMISRQTIRDFFKERSPVSQMPEKQKFWLITLPKGIDIHIFKKLCAFTNIKLTGKCEQLAHNTIDRTYRVIIMNHALKKNSMQSIDQSKQKLDELYARAPNVMEAFLFILITHCHSLDSKRIKKSKKQLVDKDCLSQELFTYCTENGAQPKFLSIGWMHIFSTIFVYNHTTRNVLSAIHDVLPVWTTQADKSSSI